MIMSNEEIRMKALEMAMRLTKHEHGYAHLGGFPQQYTRSLTRDEVLEAAKLFVEFIEGRV